MYDTAKCKPTMKTNRKKITKIAITPILEKDTSQHITTISNNNETMHSQQQQQHMLKTHNSQLGYKG